MFSELICTYFSTHQRQSDLFAFVTSKKLFQTSIHIYVTYGCIMPYVALKSINYVYKNSTNIFIHFFFPKIDILQSLVHRLKQKFPTREY